VHPSSTKAAASALGLLVFASFGMAGGAACSSRAPTGYAPLADGAADTSADSRGDAMSSGDSGGGAAPDAGDDSQLVEDTATGADAADAADTGTAADVGADSTPPADAQADAPDTSVVVGSFGASCAAPTVYEDPFSADPLAYGWQTIAGTVTYAAGDGGSGLLQLAEGSPNTQVWIGARPSWTDYTIEVRLRIDADAGSGNAGVTFRMGSTGTANNSGQMYYAGIAQDQLILGLENGSWTEYEGPPASFAIGVFYDMTITAKGDVLGVSVASPDAGVTSTSYTNTDTDAVADFTAGSFGFRTFNMAMSYASVTVTCD
jgi:hypothetical protein